jgi:hypothetical protein
MLLHSPTPDDFGKRVVPVKVATLGGLLCVLLLLLLIARVETPAGVSPPVSWGI